MRVVWGDGDGDGDGEPDGDGDGHEAMWSYDKFMDRLYLMRELYQKFEEEGIASVTGLPADKDPFTDTVEAALIGKALAYLDPLSYLIEIEEKLPIMDYRGMLRGALSVEIVPQMLDTDGSPVRGSVRPG